ncbi:MAG: type II toxin-antitoxin system Phd/YefM family antitoxin [Burkholderiaceae bacterium]|jgi:prevent-host-death family protein
MTTISLAEAKAGLSELLNKVERGQEVVITRRGHPIARLLPVQKKKQRLRSLEAFRSQTPKANRPSMEVLSELRDEGF